MAARKKAAKKTAKRKPPNRGVNNGKMGAPTKYTKQMPANFLAHYQSAYDECNELTTEELKAKLIKLPSVVTFSSQHDICQATLYLWRDKYPEFKVAMEQANKIAAEMTKLLAINNVWNPNFSTFVLKSCHGYVDKTTVEVEDTSIHLTFDAIDEEA